jgi:hypothetical protein
MSRNTSINPTNIHSEKLIRSVSAANHKNLYPFVLDKSSNHTRLNCIPKNSEKSHFLFCEMRVNKEMCDIVIYDINLSKCNSQKYNHFMLVRWNFPSSTTCAECPYCLKTRSALHFSMYFRRRYRSSTQ